MFYYLNLISKLFERLLNSMHGNMGDKYTEVNKKKALNKLLTFVSIF